MSYSERNNAPGRFEAMTELLDQTFRLFVFLNKIEEESHNGLEVNIIF